MDAADLGAFAGTGSIDLGVAGYGTTEAKVRVIPCCSLGRLAGMPFDFICAHLRLQTSVSRGPHRCWSMAAGRVASDQENLRPYMAADLTNFATFQVLTLG